MNQQPAPVIGVIARGGAGTGVSPVPLVDPTSPTWANELFRSHGVASTAILFVPQLERHPHIGQGTQVDELLPEHSPQVAVVPLPTHVTGILAALRDCTRHLSNRAEFIAAVRAHVQASYAGAWLKRVAKLEDPEPSLTQHLQSWLPFSHGQFVGLHPSVSVRRRPDPMRAQPGTVVLRTSTDSGAWVGSALAAAYTPQHQEVLPAAHRLSLRWGTDRVLEYVATPNPQSLPLPPAQGRCPNCGDPVWGQCAFCHLTATEMAHWQSVTIPGTEAAESPVPPAAAPPADEPEDDAPPPETLPAPPPRRAFQLPRHRAKH